MQTPPPLPANVRPALSQRPAWHARLSLVLAERAGRCVVKRCEHFGPLRIQKTLYPEGPELAHLLLLHPPSGIAGGDVLDIQVHVESAAHALLTTPGAGKWYKAAGRVARQRVQLRIDAGATLEWLPQEAIVFDHAEVEQVLRVDCHGSGCCVGWDLVVLGRRGSGECFEQGRWQQRIDLFRDGECLWSERSRLVGGDPLLQSAVGWNARHVCGLMWVMGMPGDEALLDACRAVSMDGVHLGVTAPREALLLVRALGDSVERVRDCLSALWTVLRPAVIGRAAIAPRIWAT